MCKNILLQNYESGAQSADFLLEAFYCSLKERFFQVFHVVTRGVSHETVC